MKIFSVKNSLSVILSDGRIIQTSECTNEMLAKVRKYYEEDNEFEIINLLLPEKEEEVKLNVRLITFWNRVASTSELTTEGDSVYWKSVSPLSLPQSFAERIMQAEQNGDTKLLNAYRNFWLLLSLNPDDVVRKNLFKFLDKWGMSITKSGLFIGYRNAELKEKGETLETSIFTDVHSHSTTIKIGSMVTMDESKIDCDSSVECSRGLHIGGTSWLRRNYFGTTGLVCLVDPRDVRAVPWQRAEYGKLRCRAYLPIAIAEYKENNIVPFTLDCGMEEPFVSTILYDGVIAPESDESVYHIPLPENPNSNVSVSDKILKIAKDYIAKRQ